MRGLKRNTRNNPFVLNVSHLLQMRGLKPCGSCVICRKRKVASFTDAWIETHSTCEPPFRTASHLLQMRGLKQLTKAQAEYTEVASFTDAWIETLLQ